MITSAKNTEWPVQQWEGIPGELTFTEDDSKLCSNTKTKKDWREML